MKIVRTTYGSQLVAESKFMTVVLNKRPNTICKMAYLAM